MPGLRVLLSAIVGLSLIGTASADERSRAREGHVLPAPDPTAQPVVTAGGGVDGFIGTALRGLVGPGPSWNVRAAMGSREDVRIELVYAGTSQSFKDAEMGGARLVGHGVHALLRANVAPSYLTEPFFFAGAGWTRFSVSGDAEGRFRSPDHMLEIPFGFGVSRQLGRLVLDVRASFSIMTGADLVPATQADGTARGGESMHRAGLRANLGIAL
ncbi:MAG TPA: hypothetical protein VNO30_34560 [Kofleriaceae bacterium]|nr:hypothetical protein [Kofleriaceae bacterium]